MPFGDRIYESLDLSFNLLFPLAQTRKLSIKLFVTLSRFVDNAHSPTANSLENPVVRQTTSEKRVGIGHRR